MSLEQILLLLVIFVPILPVVINRLRMDTAALIIAVTLGVMQFSGIPMLSSVRSPQEAVRAISGFGQPVVITLISLFIITRSLEKSGVTRWIARKVVDIGGSSERKLIALFSATAAFLSLFMNNLAAGVLLLPSAIEVARKTNIKPSKLLIPISFGSLLGGTATYFTTANIIISDLLTISKPPQAPLNILDFTPTGGLITIAGIIFLAFFGKRYLPDHPPAAEQMMTRLTGSELEDFYQLGRYLFEICVQPSSPLVGKTLAQTGIGHHLGITVAVIWHGKQAFFSPSPEQVINANDILLVVGREERVRQMQEEGVSFERIMCDRHISTRGVRLVEMILSPQSKAVGHSLIELNFRRNHGLTIVALRRLNRSYRTNIGDLKLTLGDSLLAIGSRRRVANLQKNPDFIVLEPNPSDQPVNLQQTLVSTGIVLLSIFLSIFSLPIYLAMLIGAVLVILLKIITIEEAYRAVEWQAVFMIAGMYTVSLAMVETGIASLLGTFVVNIVTPFGALGLSAGAYLLSAVLTQIMGGQVTALVTGPVAISSAIEMGVDTHAIAVAAAIGCSASFFTPLAHPINMIMMTSANYTFSDFFRIGWRLTILCFFILLLGMMIFWSL